MFCVLKHIWKNARKSIKISKDSDFTLVSNEHMNEILPSSCWALGQVAWTKMAKNPPHYDITHKKYMT